MTPSTIHSSYLRLKYREVIALTKNKNGSLFFSQKHRKTKVGWAVTALMAFMASVAMLLATVELTGFSQIGSLWVMLSVSAGICLLYGCLEQVELRRWFYPTVLCAVLLLVVGFGKGISYGACTFWNQLGDTWTAQTGQVLPALELPEGDVSLLPFSVLLGMTAALLCCLLTDSLPVVLAVLLPGVVLLIMVCSGRQAAYGCLMPVLCGAVVLLLYGGNAERPLAIMARLLPVSLVCGLLLWAVSLPSVRSWTGDVSAELRRQVHSCRYETAYSTLPEGDFSQYQPRMAGEQPALVVTMSVPEAMYLRGFTGAVFEGERWSELDCTILAEQEDLLYWLNRKEFHLQAQYAKAAAGTDPAINMVTVQNIGACSRYLYVPFSLCDGAYLNTQDLRTGGIRWKGDRIYLFSAVSGGKEEILRTLEYLQKSDESVVLAYRRAESAYRQFVNQHYLDIPRDVADTLQPYWDEARKAHGSGEALTTEQAQSCVLSVLETCFPDDETQKVPGLPLEMAKGSSFQYATVAALTLRHFGIPTRYAEGYVISEAAAAASGADGNIQVDSSCAAAWVEVYHDGIGWIPADLLPGMDGVMPDPNAGEDDDQKRPGQNAMKEGQELEETEEQTQKPDGGYTISLPEMMRWSVVVVLLLVLLLLAALILLRRKLLLNRKQKKFRAANQKDAVAWLFADAVAFLENMGLRRGKGSMASLVEPARQQLGEAYAAELEKMVVLNGRALFSSHSLQEDDVETARAFHHKTLEHLRTTARWYQKIWMQWVLCLY